MSYPHPFFGFHTRFADHEAVDGLLRLIEKGLAPLGINALILEFNPGYSYRCFPEYSNGTVTFEDCLRIKEACKDNGIKAIPLFQCLSHQSDQIMGGKAWPLLKAHPEFCETPNVPENAKWPDFYTHCWCASNDGIYKYIFPMMDELIEVFEADVVHVGIDEVFEIGTDVCERCKGKNKAELLARTVKILHDHLKEKNVNMMMWGDRLLNAHALGYQTWEADELGMHHAFDRADEVTRDIVITDWHYDIHEGGYPSIQKFTDAGFKTIAAFGGNVSQVAHFSKYCMDLLSKSDNARIKENFEGFLFTHWSTLNDDDVTKILAGIGGAAPTEKHSDVNIGHILATTMNDCASW